MLCQETAQKNAYKIPLKICDLAFSSQTPTNFSFQPPLTTFLSTTRHRNNNFPQTSCFFTSLYKQDNFFSKGRNFQNFNFNFKVPHSTTWALNIKMSQPQEIQPTSKEAFFFMTILNSMKNKPDVDWSFVADKCGYSNGNCAKVRFGQIKKRLDYTDDATAPAAAKPRTTTPKKTNGSGTNANASKVKKTPSKPRNNNGKVSKAQFAEAALLHSQEEDKYSVKNPGNPTFIKEEDEMSGTGSYNEDAHSENIEGYEEEHDDFFDAET